MHKTNLVILNITPSI